jgi:protein CpxP
MKRTKIAVALLAATLITGAGFAQTTAGSAQTTSSTQAQEQQAPQARHGHKGQRMPTPEERLQHLTKKLNLTEDQQAKIKPILEQQQQQAQTLRDDKSLSKQDRQAKFLEMHKDFSGQIRAQLNPDQQAKFDQMVQQHEQRMQQHHKAAETKPAS